MVEGESKLPKKTNGKRNRQAGHGLELELARKFREIGFPHVVTTRSESRSRDNQGIDLINSDERVNGRFPFNVQSKNTTSNVPYAKLLADMPVVPDVVNVVIHKQTARVNDRFIGRGKYAILNLEDFLELVRRLKEYDGDSK